MNQIISYLLYLNKCLFYCDNYNHYVYLSNFFKNHNVDFDFTYKQFHIKSNNVIELYSDITTICNLLSFYNAKYTYSYTVA